MTQDMTRDERPGPGAGQRPGGGRNDIPWPKRPMLTALWIPAAAVLLPVGGALAAFGPWLMVPGLALALTGIIGLIIAVCLLCPTNGLRGAALALVMAPLIAVPLLSMNTAQATVLSMRGTEHAGTVTDVRVSHGKTTTYSCAVRYEDVPGRVRTVSCRAEDTVGEHVSVTEDPGGLVDPEFSDEASGGRVDLVLAAFSDVALVVVAAVAATAGALVHRTRVRRGR
ncbi:hypothetical protein [Kitasatospora aureofaciens]|uniref:hypothetical protein n=1 Tax=Kitasatospora aureofaciens TaxID=1894 RepID=UPI001C447BC6|nr:hypothetical protein [Kitasatospora aureofaciens]MBV6703001.1 hypothetical protein [Kitasatospora aureofaciens]